VRSRVQTVTRLVIDVYHAVLAEPLIQRLKTRENDVKVIRISRLEEGEHCDSFW
jgi:hypothetical protein